MLTKLLLLFILVPAIELILLIEIGQLIGIFPTIGLIVFTGALGALLVRRQGIRALARIRNELQTGQLPADSIFDGAIILIAGAFLMTPGILTDTLGFLCLIPATRRIIKKGIWSRIERAIRSGQIMTTTHAGIKYQDKAAAAADDDVIIIDYDSYK